MVPSLPLLSCELSVSVKENPDRILKQTFWLLKRIWSKLKSAKDFLKQVETNLWKKDEKINQFASKFEVNLKGIWKEFEENSSLHKLRAQSRSGAQGKNKGCLIGLQISSRIGKTMTNLKWIPNTIVTRVLVIFW